MTNIVLNLPRKLRKSIEQNAALSRISCEAFVTKILEKHVIPAEQVRPHLVERGLPKLKAFLERIPGVRVISFDQTHESFWWIIFDIDITHPLAWQVVQELGFVLNYISISQQLPTVFMPVSPPPYLNGGPEEYLSWVIESKLPCTDPNLIAQILEGRLPSPVEDPASWHDKDSNEDEEDEDNSVCERTQDECQDAHTAQSNEDKESSNTYINMSTTHEQHCLSFLSRLFRTRVDTRSE